MPAQVLPVIQPGAFELRVIELEAERFDQVQSGPRGGAKARDVAGVGRNFWFNQDNVHVNNKPSTKPGRARARSCRRRGGPFCQVFA
jgi:hypothetical protein